MSEDFRKKDGSYHHGDLKSALMEAAAIILETRGAEALTLREAARRAGVSEAAPYRHFSDKAALIDAVVEQSLIAMIEDIASAMSPFAGERRRALEAGAMAMLGFAFAQSGRYRLLFLPRSEPLARFHEIVELFAAEARSIATARQIWTTVHGAAALALTRQITESQAEEIARTALAQY